MDGDNDMKSALGEDDDDLRFQNRNFIQLPLLVEQREIGHKFYHSTTSCLEKWGEESFVKRQHSHLACQIPSTAKTTYLLAFSPDGTKVASSHGDHNIYVSEVKTGKCICTLRGHPRSPWCVAFHPSSNEIIASGCLGGEVRVWDLKGGSEMWTPNKKCVTDKKSVIASLAFHPSDQVLVIATENDLYFWDWFCLEPFAKISTTSKLEKIKYVEFDPLGYKLITGIAIVRSERSQLDVSQRTNPTNNDNANDNDNNNDTFGNTAEESDSLLRNSRSLMAVSSATNRLYTILDRVMRRRNNNNNNNNNNNTSPSSVEDNVNESENPSNLFFHQRVALNRARNFAQSLRERMADNEPGSGTAPDPSSLSDFPPLLSSTRSSIFPPRRRPLMPRSSSSFLDDDPNTHHRLMSEDSASSSSLDSSSSVTSGVSGASNERNTRLSLLWTSRLNRGGGASAGGGGGNDSDNSGGGGYDLEERRGEGTVMRAGAASEPGHDSLREGGGPISLHSIGNPRYGSRDRRISSSLRSGSVASDRNSARYIGLSNLPDSQNEVNNNNSEDRVEEASTERSRVPLPARSAAGQGGRWMYYRGKASSDSSSSSNRPQRIGKSSIPSLRSGRVRSRDMIPSRSSEDLMAVPGPSGLSPGNAASTSRNNSYSSDRPPRSDRIAPTRSSNRLRRSRSQNASLLDPQYGVRLLSRHIEHMQSICRSLSLPRTRMELTRHRNDISQLQQIRSMLYDIQHQIRSLRVSVDQTISDEFSGMDESLNSTSVDPEPLTTELLRSRGGLTDQVEVEVNIGTEDIDQYSYLPLNEVSTDHLEQDDSLLSPSEQDPVTMDISTASDETPPPNETVSSSTPLPRSSVRTRNYSGTLRNISGSRYRSRRSSRSLETWTGLVRRVPALRRALIARMHPSAPSLGASGEGMRYNRLRNLREIRRDQRRTRLHNRRLERNRLAATSPTNADAHGNSGSRLNSRSNSSPQVRHRHRGDWQRRMREAILFLNQQRRDDVLNEDDNQDSSAISPSLPSNNSDLTSLQRRDSSATVTDSSNTASNVVRPNSSRSYSLTSTLRPENDDGRAFNASDSISQNSAISGSASTAESTSFNCSGVVSFGPDNEDDPNETPDRVTRAGPPTTSLSSRIATMLAQQREARTQNQISQDQGDADVIPPNVTLSDRRMPIRPRMRSLRSRLDARNRTDTEIFSGIDPRLLESESLSNSSLLDTPMESGNDNGDSLRPMYQRLRSLRREIMINHRNRMLRRSTNSLVTGRDLVGATLAAIDPEQETQRRTFQRDRTESFRHMLQMMADRLNQMMEQSFPGEDVDSMFSSQRSVLEQYNLRPRQNPRRSLNESFSLLSQNSSDFLNDELNNVAENTTANLNRHMQNLRLLVQVALHLIYQLLNFICNRNLSYEERPISRLPNPFREEGNSSQRNPLTNSSTNGNAQNSTSGSFEMDIEPGLHNLTTLLETVQMASEELRNDALNTVEVATNARNARSRLNQRRNAIVASNLSVPDVNRSDSSELPTRSGDNVSRSTVRRRLTDFLIRTGNRGSRRSHSPTPSDDTANPSGSNGRSSSIQRPQPTTPSAASAPDVPPQFPIPQIILNDILRDNSPTPESSSRPFDAIGNSQDEVGFHLRTFGGIPLRLLGRQNAVDRRSPDPDDPSGGPSNEPENNNRRERGLNDRSFFWYSNQRQHPWNNAGGAGGSASGANQNPFSPPERDPDSFIYFNQLNQPYFSHYIATSRNIGGSLFDPYSPGFYNNNNSFYRIQAWDYRNFEIPDISDSFRNVVVWKCRIHFDASVSISVDGTLLAAVLPDSKSLTRIGVYSLETKSLGQLLYSSSIGFNIVSVSLSPTMNHLVVGISSHRLGVHHNERQVIGRIYKLCLNPAFPQGEQPGILKFCRGIELAGDIRQSSLNCIRWIPVPGQGLVYGTNRGQLSMLR